MSNHTATMLTRQGIYLIITYRYISVYISHRYSGISLPVRYHFPFFFITVAAEAVAVLWNERNTGRFHLIIVGFCTVLPILETKAHQIPVRSPQIT